ncbi:MAG: glycoside hydrolase family 5 protein [Lachnospiraceae bacterium]|nr:glycoside hydrolase family 5 protein [Lachnospiraceae bacterium]
MKNRIIRIITAFMAAAVLLAGCGKTELPQTQSKPEESITAEPGVTPEEAEPTEAPKPTEEPTPTEAPAEDNGLVDVRLAIKGTVPESEAMAFTRDMRVGWNLGNTFDARDSDCADEMDYETVWSGAKTTKELIHTMKEAGFNTIRVPVSWHNHIDANNRISEKWMDRVEEVVGWITDEGMYAIINIHHDDDYYYPSYARLDSGKKYLKDIWTQVAERFADYDEHVIFETMNEPRQVGTDYEWWIADKEADYAKECFDCINQLNQVAVDTIRANGKGHNNERYIMVPGYCAAPEFEMYKDFKVPDDPGAADHIIISAHAYTPYDFALNKSGTSEFSIKGQKGTGDIDYFVRGLHRTFIIKGIPVVISEWGSLDKKNLESRLDFTAYYVTMAANYGMPTVIWDNNAYNTDGENFAIINRETLEWRFPEIRDQLIYSASQGWGE